MSQNFNYPASNGGYTVLNTNTGGYTIANAVGGLNSSRISNAAGTGYEVYNYSNTGASASGPASNTQSQGAIGGLISGISTGGPAHVSAAGGSVINTTPIQPIITASGGGGISVPTGSAAAAVSNASAQFVHPKIPSSIGSIGGPSHGGTLPTVGDTLTGGSSIGAVIGHITGPSGTGPANTGASYVTYSNDYINNGSSTPGLVVQSTGNSGLSAIEAAILRSSVPIEINETEEITVNGQRGIWANKSEVVGWQGHLPISEYAINQDANPEVITKRSNQQLVYQQEVAIRYLRPPTPPPPGEIIIQQELNTLTPPAPPLIIRQQPPRPITPQPLVVREAPPPPPAQVGRKVITISGKRIPPPPRKVVIERLAPLPSKPQSVIIERWLPYSQVKRRVIFQKSNDRDPVIVKPRNVIIQWEAPQVTIKKEFKDLGVIRANPAEYVARYGTTLKTARELPPFVLEIKPPSGVVLAADYQFNSIYELEGDIQALRLIDLDREGLGEYKSLVQRLAVTGSEGLHVHQISNPASSGVPGLIATVTGGTAAPSAPVTASIVTPNVINDTKPNQPSPPPAPAPPASTTTSNNQTNQNAQLVNEVFNALERDHNGKLSVEEAERLLLRLNSRLGRRFGEEDVKRFFESVPLNRDGQVEVADFRRAFEANLF